MEVEDGLIIREDDIYYSITGRLSPSGLKFLNTHPRAYQEYLANGVERSIHIDKGRLYHSCLNEPHTVETNYTYLKNSDLPEPDKTFRSKANREYRDRFIEENKHKTVFESEDDYNNIITLTKEIHRNPMVKNLLEGCEAELGMCWKHFETGVSLKGKPDVFKRKSKGRSYILDFKKLPDISPRKVRQYLRDRFIPSQLAVYADGLRELGLCDPDDYYILAICDKPADYALYKINEFIDEGYSEFLRLGFLYKKCTDENNWPGYEIYGDSQGIISLTNYGQKEYTI